MYRIRAVHFADNEYHRGGFTEWTPRGGIQPLSAGTWIVNVRLDPITLDAGDPKGAKVRVIATFQVAEDDIGKVESLKARVSDPAGGNTPPHVRTYLTALSDDASLDQRIGFGAASHLKLNGYRVVEVAEPPTCEWDDGEGTYTCVLAGAKGDNRLYVKPGSTGRYGVQNNWDGTSIQLTAIVNGFENTSTTRSRAIGGWRLTVIPNSPPGFTSAAQFTVGENQAQIGKVIAEDEDSQDAIISYQIIGGMDRNQFNIDRTTGQLSFITAPNYEEQTSYKITVKVISGEGGRALEAREDISVMVTDVDEPPGKPLAPEEVAAGPDRFTVTWTAPDNTGPDITDYDIEYRKRGTSTWHSQRHVGTGTSATISGLESGTYEVRVQAFNEEGSSRWSDAADVMTAELGELTVSFDAGTYNVREDDGVATVTVNLSRRSDQKFSIPINVEAVSDGSTSYILLGLDSGELSFEPGFISQNFGILIVVDDDPHDVKMSLAFGSPLPAGVARGDPNSAILFIADISATPATPTPTPEPMATATPEPMATAVAQAPATTAPEPTLEPTPVPQVDPTAEPTAVPTLEPTPVPQVDPTAEPTAVPTVEPTPTPPVDIIPPTDGGRGFPIWAIVLIVIGVIGLAGGTYYLGLRRNR